MPFECTAFVVVLNRLSEEHGGGQSKILRQSNLSRLSSQRAVRIEKGTKRNDCFTTTVI